MTFQPAHKDTNNPPGQIKNEITLTDYIQRVIEQETPKKKLSFDEWFYRYNKEYGLPPAQVVAEAAWKAGQENK